MCLRPPYTPRLIIEAVRWGHGGGDDRYDDDDDDVDDDDNDDDDHGDVERAYDDRKN